MSKIKKILTRLSIVLLLALTIVGGCYHYARSDLTFVDFSKLQVLLDGTKNIALGAVVSHSATTWKNQKMDTATISPVFKWIVSGYTKTEFSSDKGDHKGPYYLGLAYDSVTYYDASGTSHTLAYTDFGDVTVKIKEDAGDIASSTIGGTGIASDGVTNTDTNRTLKLSSQELGKTGGGYNNQWKLVYNFDTSNYDITGYDCEWVPQNNTTLAGSAHRVQETFTLYLNKKTVNGVTKKDQHNYSITGANEGGAEGNASSLNMNLLKRNGEEYVLKYKPKTVNIKFKINGANAGLGTFTNWNWDGDTYSTNVTCHAMNTYPSAVARNYRVTFDGGAFSELGIHDENNSTKWTTDHNYIFKGWSIGQQANETLENAKARVGTSQWSSYTNSKNETFAVIPGGASVAVINPVVAPTFTARWEVPKTTIPDGTRTGYILSSWTAGFHGGSGAWQVKTYSRGNDGSFGTFGAGVTSDITFTANWDPIKYDVVFDGNAGNASTKDQVKVPANMECTFDVFYLPDTPTLPGYDFTGWKYTNEKGEECIINPNNSFANLRSSYDAAGKKKVVTLSAQWKPKKYTIVYKHNDKDDNGAGKAYPNMSSQVSGNESTQEVTFDKEDTLKSTKYSMVGYNFIKDKSWNTKQDGSGTVYSLGSKFTLSASNMGLINSEGKVNLWSRWTPIKYKVKFYGNKKNASTDLKNEPTGVVHKDDTKKTSTTEMIYDETYYPDKEISLFGYKFLDWNTKDDGTGTAYNTGGTSPALPALKNLTTTENATVNLYGHWEAKKYTLWYRNNDASYNNKGGTLTVNEAKQSNGSEDEKSVTVTFDSPKQLEKKTLYKLQGWSFNEEKSWNDRLNGSGKAYAQGSSFTLCDSNKDLVIKNGVEQDNFSLYAQWTPNTYIFWFDGNKPTSITHSHYASREPGLTRTEFADNETAAQKKLDKLVYVYESDYSKAANKKDTLKESGFYLHGWFWNCYGLAKDSLKQKNKGNKDAVTLDTTSVLKTVVDDHFGDNLEKILYCQWKVNSYKIKYDANGGKSEDDVTSITNNYLFDKDYSLLENIFSKVDKDYNKLNKLIHTPIEDSYKDRYTEYSTVRNTTYKSDFEYYFLGWSFSETAKTAAGVHYKDKAVFRNIPDAFDIYCDRKIDTPCNTSEHRADKAGKTYGLYAVWNAIPNLTVNSTAVRFDYYEGADITATMQLFLLRK